MTANKQHNNILLAVIGFIAVIAIVATIGYFTIDNFLIQIHHIRDAHPHRQLLILLIYSE